MAKSNTSTLFDNATVLSCGKYALQVGLVFITPDMAKKWLEGADNFRVLDFKRLAKYKEQMTEDSWEVNGETIKLDATGKCIDGQHRLQACIDSNKPFISLVVAGCTSAEADRGKPRTINQELRHMGFKDCSALSSICNVVYWSLRGKHVCDNTFAVQMSFTELHDLLLKNPELQQYARTSCTVARLCRSSLVGSIPFIGCKVAGLSHEIGINFIKGISDDTLPITDPRRALRERLTRNKLSKYKIGTQELAALIIKAWNLYLLGKTAMKQSLNWRANEAYPQFITKEDYRVYLENVSPTEETAVLETASA